jgi:hypothetical protein
MRAASISNLLITLGIAGLITGCAHPISMSPDPGSIAPASSSEKNGRSISYYYSEDIDKEVITPGGGGDKVRYKPYKDIDGGLYKVFSTVFSEVTSSPTQKSGGNTNSDYSAAVSIVTNSSSASLFTWPPTLFSVDLIVELKDNATNNSIRVQSRGEGRAEFGEFKGNFSLSAQRASTDALSKLQAALKASKFNKPLDEPSSPNRSGGAMSKEARLRELKKLFDQGLINPKLYNERQKSILAE